MKRKQKLPHKARKSERTFSIRPSNINTLFTKVGESARQCVEFGVQGDF
jgi:hypothetical protein